MNAKTAVIQPIGPPERERVHDGHESTQGGKAATTPSPPSDGGERWGEEPRDERHFCGWRTGPKINVWISCQLPEFFYALLEIVRVLRAGRDPMAQSRDEASGGESPKTDYHVLARLVPPDKVEKKSAKSWMQLSKQPREQNPAKSKRKN